MKPTILITILITIFILLIGLVSATFTPISNFPSEYSVESSTAVTFNVTCLNTGDSSVNMNASVYWKTNRTGAYSSYITLGNMTNNTPSTGSYTFNNSDRVWWKSSCYDLAGEFYVLNESITLPSSLGIINLGNDTNGIVNVVGVVNYSGTYRAMNLDMDYNITNNRIYLENSSLLGNHSLWTYNYPGDIINQVNSSVRIFDVDTDYYTLSLGANRVINFSLDTGDIAFKGDIIRGNLIYGEMWNYTSNTTAWTFSIVAAGVYYNLTGLGDGNINGFTTSHNNQTYGGSKLITQVPGLYKADAAISFEGTGNNQLFSFTVVKNQIPTNSRNCYTRRYVSTQSLVGSATISCLLDLAIDDEVNIMVENEDGTADIRVHAINLNLVRMGD